MTNTPESPLPEWAQEERAGDLAWVRENLHIFWPAAQTSYQTVGRGAIVVDTTSRPTNQGHPFGYFDQQAIEQGEDEDTQRLVREYDPSWEFVAVLLKTHNRLSSYRVGVVSAKEIKDSLDSQAETSEPGGPPALSSPEPPDLETLMAWEEEGYCEATDGCVVEPDGTCPHGHHSWLLELGLI
jgi:hypothetical protein